MKKIDIDWNYWLVRFFFVLALFLSFKLITHFTVVLATLEQLLSVLSPFILGFIVAYLLSGPQKKLEVLFQQFRSPWLQKKSKGLSIFILYALALFFIFLTLNYLVPLLLKNAMDLINLLPVFFNYLSDLSEQLADNGIIELMKLEDLLASVATSFSPEKLLRQGTASLASLGLFAKSLSVTVLNTFLVFIISIYALLYKESILLFCTSVTKKVLSEEHYQRTKILAHRSSNIFYKFIGGQFLDSCIVGVLATILLTLLGVKFSVTLGLLLGICTMIPYFGSIFASVVTMIITFFTGGLNLALITIVSLLILQQIDGNIIGPRIMKGALNLNPILIIVSITVGGAYFGVLGMFLSVPIAALLKIVIVEWLEGAAEDSHSAEAPEV